jgi:K(+)-stimulated pyrophosphate-energized sodium pump
MRLVMVLASGASYIVNEFVAKARYATPRDELREGRSEPRLASVDGSPFVCTYVASYVLIRDLGVDGSLWWSCRRSSLRHTPRRGDPEVTTVLTSTIRGTSREVVTASREGGASLNVLSGLTAGNFSAFWIAGVVIVSLMAIAYGVSTQGLHELMKAEAVFAFGLVAFGFLGMGPVTIAVDSYGPVTDNAQSVYELSLIEQVPNIKGEIKSQTGVDADFEQAKYLLEENDGAGNTFKATAKPVLIGTAVVGATTMIFSIIMLLTDGLANEQALADLSIMHAPVPARPARGRRGDLLVHGRVDAGGNHRRVPRRRVHQEAHEARLRRQEGVDRGEQAGRRHLHEVRAGGHVQHLPDRLLHHPRRPRSSSRTSSSPS